MDFHRLKPHIKHFHQHFENLQRRINFRTYKILFYKADRRALYRNGSRLIKITILKITFIKIATYLPYQMLKELSLIALSKVIIQ